MEHYPPDNRIIKTYVWHGDKCFFVSTIERESSAMEGPRRYNETIVWKCEWEKGEREMLHQYETTCLKARSDKAEGIQECIDGLNYLLKHGPAG